MKKRIILSLLVFVTTLINAQNKKQNEVLKFSMQTRWADSIDPNHVWDVYPRPQLVRDNWINLNGKWEYAIRPVKSKNIPSQFDGEILVPFAVESELSGVKKLVGEKNYLWYKTNFKAPDLKGNEQLHLNFGAVDWETAIYINGEKVGMHKGGYTPFTLNITKFLNNKDENDLVVRVWDPTDSGMQARGKQTATPQGIWYTPVTGIWQTVWLEKTAENYITSIKATPNIDDSTLKLQLLTEHQGPNLLAEVSIRQEDNTIVQQELEISKISKQSKFKFDIPKAKLWSPDNPFLYDLTIKLKKTDGTVIDEVKSYFGMRKIALGKDDFGRTVMQLNNEDIFQFGLLDQGWWPDGLYTAPTPEAMLWDVKKTQELGFNTIRKHVKVEPAIYYYECDKRGMLVWQDMPNGNYLHGLRLQAWEEDVNRPTESAMQFEWELREMIDKLYSFPSIIVWVPFNEGWGQYDTERIANWVSSYDPSRINDNPSGWADRGVGDLVDVHIYPGPGMEKPESNRASVIGEFGGLGLTVEDHLWWDKKNWGYLTYDKPSDFEERFTELVHDLYALRDFGLSAAIYTQTTDVEGEVNGLITYDREVVKLDVDKTRELLAPLYEKPKEKITLVKDAEHSPNKWAVYTGNKQLKTLLKNKKTKSRDWKMASAPFSSYDNFFLPKGTEWPVNEELIVKKDFNVNQLPSDLIFKYYLSKASMKVYINGKLVLDEKYQGGRKRHYRFKSLVKEKDFLQVGSNNMLIVLSPQSEESSFDIGLYASPN